MNDPTIVDVKITFKVEESKTELVQLKRALRELKKADKGLVGILRALSSFSLCLSERAVDSCTCHMSTGENKQTDA